MATKPKRLRDPNQLVKLIVDISTREVKDCDPDKGKDPAAVALGREGWLNGGAARAQKLTAEQRSSIAKKAAKTRWSEVAERNESGESSEQENQRRVLKTPR